MNTTLRRDLTFLPWPQPEHPAKEGMYVLILDSWWMLDPARGLAVYGGFSPQCNANRALAESLRARLHPDFELVHVPWAWLGPVDPHDYA